MTESIAYNYNTNIRLFSVTVFWYHEVVFRVLVGKTTLRVYNAQQEPVIWRMRTSDNARNHLCKRRIFDPRIPRNLTSVLKVSRCTDTFPFLGTIHTMHEENTSRVHAIL